MAKKPVNFGRTLIPAALKLKMWGRGWLDWRIIEQYGAKLIISRHSDLSRGKLMNVDMENFQVKASILSSA